MSDVNPDVDLDLDELQPAPKKVKIAGIIVEVVPPKFNDLLDLMNVSTALQNTTADSDTAANVSKMRELLEKMAPAIKENGVELTMDQFHRLLTFIFSMATPTEQKELQANGIDLNPEKKTEDEPVPSSS